MIMTEPVSRKGSKPPGEDAQDSPEGPAPPEEMELVGRARKGYLSAYD